MTVAGARETWGTMSHTASSMIPQRPVVQCTQLYQPVEKVYLLWLSLNTNRSVMGVSQQKHNGHVGQGTQGVVWQTWGLLTVSQRQSTH